MSKDTICITRDSKFNETVHKLNIHPDDLELILHKYANMQGREGYYPTENEILSEIRPKPFEATEAQMKTYLNTQYNGSRTFSTLNAAREYLEKLNTLYYPGTPTMYRNREGNYVVGIGTPMLKNMPYSIDDNVVEEVFQDLDMNNEHHKALATLIKVIGKNNIKVRMKKIDPAETSIKGQTDKWGNPLAEYNPNNRTIYYDPFTFNQHLQKLFGEGNIEGKKSEFRRILLHELLHQLTLNVLRAEETSLKPEELAFKQEIERLYNIAKRNTDRDHYGLFNIEEFVAELYSNNNFRRYLNSIEDRGETVWKRFVNAFHKLLRKLGYNIPIKKSVLSSALNATTTYINFYEKESKALAAEAEIVDEMFKDYTENIPDDLFIPSSTENYYSLKERFEEKAIGYREDEYMFDWVLLKRKGGNNKATALYIPTYIGSLREAEEKGYKMLEKLGFDKDDFKFTDAYTDYSTGKRYMIVNIKPLTERQRIADEKRKAQLEEEETRRSQQELAILEHRAKVMNSFTQEELDYIHSIEDTHPTLAQEILDGFLTIPEANEIVRDGEAYYREDQESLSSDDALKQSTETSTSEAVESTETVQEQQSIKEENKSFMEESASISRQIDNLMGSTVLTASEVRDIAEQVMCQMSDYLDAYQSNPEALFANFPEKRTLEDVNGEKVWTEKNKKSDIDKVKAFEKRIELVNFIGVEDLLNFCKEKFSPENIDADNLDTLDKAELVYQNWEAIIRIANSTLLELERFSIVQSKDGKTSEATDKINTNNENFNESNSQTDVTENEGNLQEHWQVNTRTIDTVSELTNLVRAALNKCYVFDNNGNKVKSEFGVFRRVGLRNAVNHILEWTQGATDLDQMINKLRSRETVYPWIKQVVDKLSDPKEVDFKSQFFSTFCRHSQLYSVVTLEDGTYQSMIVNEDNAIKDIIKEIKALISLGEHPLFNSTGINKERLKELVTEVESLEEYNKPYYNFTGNNLRREVSGSIGYIANLFEYNVTPEIVDATLTKENFVQTLKALKYIVKTLNENVDNKDFDPFEFKKGIGNNLKTFFRPIADYFGGNVASSFYDSGKMYQGYTIPSYLTKLMKKFTENAEGFLDFIENEYGKYAWFKDPEFSNDIERGWRNEWLRQLVTDKNALKVFKHKVQLNFNKKNYMKNMSDIEYTLSLITEYFNSSAEGARVPAWFRVPMLSNKPSSEFIRFYSERGVNYKDVLVNGFKQIFDQELSRIQTVELRNLPKNSPEAIKNFETNGKKFNFLDFMNDYLIPKDRSVMPRLGKTELAELIREKLDGKAVDEVKLNALVKEVIKDSMQKQANTILRNWENQGIISAANKVENIGKTEEEILDNLENFIWNDTFAAMNILQLTITDIAFYKDAEDLQKRLAQIHAPGVRANIKVTDYNGNAVTDGKFRTIKLKDFDKVVSNIIENVEIVFDRKIEKASGSEKEALISLKESLVGKDGAFRQINVTDAQGYSSPSSYRKKALVFGKWSKQAEEVYNRLKEGVYTYSDLKIAFQPLKPFVYSQIEKDSNVRNPEGEQGILESLKVPVQYKNSEYLLIMADALLRGENTGKPNLLRAIYDVMEESHFDEDGNYVTNGIDTTQFESTVKSGLMGAIDINNLVNNPNGEAIAKAIMEANLYKTTTKEVLNNRTGEVESVEEVSYNDTFVDTVPFEDYCLQQEVPEHFKDHEQAFGSQLRGVIVSDLETLNQDNTPVLYNIESRKVTAGEFIKEFENTVAENIQSSIDKLAEELSLNTLNLKDRNIALSRILQNEISSSSRYGIDLLQACSVDENGKFKIPPGDSIQSKRVEQLINSIIKNRVNKQELPGGPVVQVSSFGTSRELNIRFKDKDGNLLKTRAEFKGTEEEYKDYIKKNQAGVAYFEVFAPIYSNTLFREFADHNGVINIQAIEMLDPDLLKMIGYRIPTEDAYSMAPIKIVGFMPREAGDGIMLPYDITLLSGSDFDVDKMYLVRKDYGIKKTKITKSALHRIIYDEIIKSQSNKINYKNKQQLNKWISQFLNDPFNVNSLTNQKVAEGYMTVPVSAYNKILKLYLSNRYTIEKPSEGKAYRDNKIVDMMYEVLTHESTAAKLLNPGNFDAQKKMGYMVEAYRKYNDTYTWKQLEEMSISELKDIVNRNKNLSFIDINTQFYKQNSAAGSLIGIFAVNRSAHAIIESGNSNDATYFVDVQKACNLPLQVKFTVAGMDFSGSMIIDPKYDKKGQLIGKVLGSLVASATDAVKDPILNLMNINQDTANVLTTLIRLGMPFEDASLFLSQNIITRILDEYKSRQITEDISLGSIINEKLQELRDNLNLNDESALNTEELTREELIKGIKEGASDEIIYKTLLAFSRFRKLATAMQLPTFTTRFNSISSAVGPLIIDNLITEYQTHKLNQDTCMLDREGSPVTIDTILNDHPILREFYRTLDLAKSIFGNMPANSNSFRNILNTLENYNMLDKIMNDRRLLSSLCNFFQSYLLVANNVVDPKDLDYYINSFPLEYIKGKYKEKYPDNALLQAIKYEIDKQTLNPVLKVNTSTLDTSQKEKLGSGWIDLYKTNPELALKLFNYNLFVGGIGYNPKTFMNVLPVYVRSRIPRYVETFETLPNIVPELVVDQFIRSNWDRVVPYRKVKFSKEHPNGTLEITDSSSIDKLKNNSYFKAYRDEELQLFIVLSKGDNSVTVKRVSPLGGNGKYLEMGTGFIENSSSTTSNNNTSNLKDNINREEEITERQEIPRIESREEPSQDELLELLYNILTIENVRTQEQSTEYIKEFKSKSDIDKLRQKDSMKKFFRNRLKKLGIEFNEELIDKVYKKLC